MDEIQAAPEDYKWVQDPKGYYTIKPFYETGVVKVRFYSSDHKLQCVFSGKKFNELMGAILKRNLISRMDHAAYLGKELTKAFIALRERLVYVQDEVLDVTNKL